MDIRHVNAACAGVLLGCVSGGIVVPLFQQGSLRSGIVLMLINGAVIGITALVVSLITTWRPPPS